VLLAESCRFKWHEFAALVFDLRIEQAREPLSGN
jgi:hypothetical protein